jgi:hypothetical protein
MDHLPLHASQHLMDEAVEGFLAALTNDACGTLKRVFHFRIDSPFFCSWGRSIPVHTESWRCTKMPARTISQWCQSQNISRSMFYKLRKLGKAPKTIVVGSARRIADRANDEWEREREAEAAVTKTEAAQ